MSNVATSREGAKVIASSSSNSKFPATNAINGDEKTCWLTTGLFPQEFIIMFPKRVTIARIRTRTRNIRKMMVQYCDQREPTNFEALYGPVELQDEGAGLQIESQQFQKTTCRYIKVKILSAWSDFAAVFKIEAEGVISGGGGF